MVPFFYVQMVATIVTLSTKVVFVKFGGDTELSGLVVHVLT